MAASRRPPAFFRSASARHWTAALVCVIAPRSGSRKNRTQSPSLSQKRPVGFLFAIGDELSAISLRKHFASESARFYCKDVMKRLLLKNWRAKLISLLLATTLWYLIKKNVATTPSPSESASPAPAAEKR